MRLTYAGDRSAPFDPATGSGSVGKVVGPSRRNAWHRCTGASYDPETDRTILTYEQIEHPARALARQQGLSAADETVGE